jgi:hypothetical protein
MHKELNIHELPSNVFLFLAKYNSEMNQCSALIELFIEWTPSSQIN